MEIIIEVADKYLANGCFFFLLLDMYLAEESTYLPAPCTTN